MKKIAKIVSLCYTKRVQYTKREKGCSKMEELTNSQKSIWVTEQYYKGSTVNSICGTAVIEEKVDFEKLKKSIQIVYKMHDNFKLRFKTSIIYPKRS